MHFGGKMSQLKKGILILESANFNLPVELGIRKCLFGKSGIQLKESGILLMIRIQNPSLTCRKFWNPVTGIWNPLHGIQKSTTVLNSPTWGDKYITQSLV